jgi:hypothetical protein
LNKFTLTVLGAVAEHERAKIIVRMMRRKKLPVASRLSERRLLTTALPIDPTATRIGNARHATPRMKKIVAYCRSAVEQQGTPSSVHRQLSAIKRYTVRRQFNFMPSR